jgi:flagellar biosynthesis GTPase FlhF
MTRHELEGRNRSGEAQPSRVPRAACLPVIPALADQRPVPPDRHRTRDWLWFVLVLVSSAVVGGGCGGCGGSGSESSQDAMRVSPEEVEKIKNRGKEEAEQERRKAEARRNAAAKTQRKAKESKEATVKAAAEQKAARAVTAQSSAKPKLPSRPSDLREWSDQDFLNARAEDDPRLAAAVEQRARNPQRSTAEAEMLASLLRSRAASDAPLGEAGGKRDAPASAGRSSDLVRAVTAALAANKTAGAWQTLAQLARGEIPLADRQTAVEGALGALLRQATPESEQLALQVLLALPEPNQQDQGKPLRDVLPRGVTAALRADASARLRKTLARAIVEGTVSARQREMFLAVLREPSPMNLESQVLIYQDESADAATRAALEKQFAAASAESLRTFLRYAAVQPAAPSPAPDWPCRVAGQLWGPSFAGFLDLQHRGFLKLSDRPSAVVLAATIPSSAMRTSLRRTLARHWPEGPQSLRAAGPEGAGLVEPGLIVVLKSVDRENGHEKPSMPAGKRPKLAKPASGPEQRPDLWGKLTEELVLDYCRRSHLAALARAAAAHRAGAATSSDPRTAEPPVSLYPDSVVSAAYRFEWPGEHASKLPELAGETLRLDYLRIEERGKPGRLLTHYRRQLKPCIERSLPDGLWLDGLVEGVGEDRARSIDVLIARAAAGPISDADDEQELTIEILSIEVRKLHE